MKTSDSIVNIAKALSLAQADLAPLSKDGTNPHFKSHYATLAAVSEAIKPIYKQGLSVVQTIQEGTLCTRLLHSSGEWIQSDVPLRFEGQTPQQIGSQISYMRRYSIMAILNLAADDDGQSASAVKPAVVAPVVKKPEPAMTTNSSQVATMKEFEMITALLEKKKLGKEVLAIELKKHGLMVVQGSSMEQVRDIYKTILGMPDGAEE